MQHGEAQSFEIIWNAFLPWSAQEIPIVVVESVVSGDAHFAEELDRELAHCPDVSLYAVLFSSLHLRCHEGPVVELLGRGCPTQLRSKAHRDEALHRVMFAVSALHRKSNRL